MPGKLQALRQSSTGLHCTQVQYRPTLHYTYPTCHKLAQNHWHIARMKIWAGRNLRVLSRPTVLAYGIWTLSDNESICSEGHCMLTSYYGHAIVKLIKWQDHDHAEKASTIVNCISEFYILAICVILRAHTGVMSEVALCRRAVDFKINRCKPQSCDLNDSTVDITNGL